MKITKFPHYLKKIYTLGPVAAARVISNRMHSSLFEQYTRYQAEHKSAAYSWDALSSKYRLGDFKTFWSSQQKHAFLFSEAMYKTEMSDTNELMRQADAFANGCFDMLGSRDQCLIAIPWHSDFRLRYQSPDADYLFDKTTYYKDFIISSGLSDRLAKDIKLPWELSRCTWFFVLGAAYKKGGNPLYSRAFSQYVTDWVSENPFLLGPNWVCPMDVGIRAFNWVWGFHFFKDSPELDETFWQTFTCSLYDHLVYLENNWEVYEKTSNHYLGDLIGYYALTWFFKDLKGMSKKAAWCHKAFLKESEKQIFQEGTAYEGSTAYHQLVTEMFYHFYLLSQEQSGALPGSFIKKLYKMFSFLDWCTTSKNYLIKIGDDDSGKLIHYGITPELIARMKEEIIDQEQKNDVKTDSIFFKEFGLAIYKNDPWHVTLRHHAYQTMQPSGHFHNDVGSVTVAVDGVPVIIDPGSFVYTPSVVWRNAFRSVAVHNTFYVEDIEPVLFNERSLFTLDLPEQTHDEKKDPWCVEHTLYSMSAVRTVSFVSDQELLITDTWLECATHTFTSCWNFTLAPEITATVHNGWWHLSFQKKVMLKIHSEDITFTLHDAWVAPGYGVKVPSKCLRATTQVTAQPVKIRLMRC